jgi:hypothetical protein
MYVLGTVCLQNTFICHRPVYFYQNACSIENSDFVSL